MDIQCYFYKDASNFKVIQCKEIYRATENEYSLDRKVTKNFSLNSFKLLFANLSRNQIILTTF